MPLSPPWLGRGRLVQAAHSAFTGQWWPTKGWVVVGVWTFVVARLAQRVYRRDTLRV
jgi:hypothetical protein